MELEERLNICDNQAEYIADGGTKDRENDDNYNGDQNENQRVFDQALAFLLHFLEHGIYLLSLKMHPGSKKRSDDCRITTIVG